MKALSIRQPWVELILRGEKDVENRSWPTHHRGPLLIHASRNVEREALEEYGIDEKTLPFGALVGVVDVVDCTEDIRSEWHIEDCFGWYLARPRRFVRPLPYKGAVGLMNVPDALVTQALQTARPPPAVAKKVPDKPATRKRESPPSAATARETIRWFTSRK